MKVFIISGKVNGMAKLGDKLYFTAIDLGQVSKVILAGEDCLSVIEKEDLSRAISAKDIKYILLIAADDSVLGKGSICGKIDEEKIMTKYRLQNAEKSKRNLNANPNNASKNNKENSDEIAKKQSKIDTFLQNTNNIDGENSNVDCLKVEARDDTNNSFDSKIEEDEKEQIQEKTFEDFDLVNESSENATNANSMEKKEVILSKSENIENGVNFVVEQMEKQVQKVNFYSQIKNDLDKFLRSYPRNEELENKIFASKWVKITMDFDYSVGVIFEDDMPQIIAYAEPYDDKCEVDLCKMQLGEWLSISPDTKRGYFIFYQNAQTGEMILNTND